MTRQLVTPTTLALLLLASGCGAAETTADDRATSAPEPPAGDSAEPQTPDASPGDPRLILRGARLALDPDRGPVAVIVARGVIDAVVAIDGSAFPDEPRDEVIDLTGRWLAPALIDSHVHALYWPAIYQLPDAGVAGAVDHAAPEVVFVQDPGALRLLAAGPIITAPGGYPTQSWGQNGYGRECADADAAVAAVADLADRGAGLIKIALAEGPRLDRAALTAVIDAAHARGLLVSVHALGDADAHLAAELGADVLAHTPVEPLSAETVAAWSDRAVISTLAAFGTAPSARANLRALRDAGARVLYGTDLGNRRHLGVDPLEVSRLVDAGLGGRELLRAATEVPADTWGFDELGAVAPGKAASLIALDADPDVDPTTLTRPVAVWIDGRARPRTGE